MKISTDRINTLSELGELKKVAGNKPIILDDSGFVHYIACGRIDVFLAPVVDGRPSGPRTCLFSASAGDCLSGIPAQNGYVLLACGLPGTELVKIRADIIQDVLRSKPDSGSPATALDNWVEKLGCAAAGESSLSGKKQVVDLKDVLEKEVAITANNPVLSVGGVLWIEPGAAKFNLCGQTEHQSSAAAYIPLGSTFRLVADRDCSPAVHGSADFARRSDFFAQLTGFGIYALSCLARDAELDLIKREKRLDRKRKLDSYGTDSAFENLASVFSAGNKKLPSTTGADSPLARAAALTAEAAGIAFDYPDQKITAEIRLDDLARNCGFRYRNVILKDNWWEKDNGPLLGFLEEGNRPVALLPASSRSYELVDPESAERTRVTDTLAETLAGPAYMFYRPFPHKALNIFSLLSYALKGCAGDLTTVLGTGCLAAVLGLLMPVMTGHIVDTVIPETSRSQLLQIGIILATCAICMGFFKMGRAIALVRLEGRMDIATQAGIWDRIPGLPAPFFRKFTAGDLAYRSMGINTIRHLLSGVTINALFSGLFSIFSFGLMLYYSPELALAALLMILLGSAVCACAGIITIRYQRKRYDLSGRMAGLVLQFITGVAKLKVTGAEDRAFARWAEIYSEDSRMDYGAGFANALMACFNSAFPVLVWGMIFWWYFTKDLKTMPTGDFLAFHSAFASLLAAMLSLAGSLPSLMNVIPLYERARPILEALPESDRSRNAPGNLSGAIEVSRASFRYEPETPPVLNELNLKINPGEFLAVVGGSGSGKSTLLRLLLGFEKPESGVVFYDNKDLETLDLREVRQQIGVVLQDGTLMQGSIYENIVGSSGLGPDQAMEAARMVGLSKDLETMPMGIHTAVSPGGGTLSGGQRQRVLIARALVKRPGILFMDEATSALDNETQQTVADSLAGLKVTRLIIAHRLSTIRNADRIAVLRNGRIVETGTHEELMIREGAYYDLVKRQIA